MQGFPEQADKNNDPYVRGPWLDIRVHSLPYRGLPCLRFATSAHTPATLFAEERILSYLPSCVFRTFRQHRPLARLCPPL